MDIVTPVGGDQGARLAADEGEQPLAASRGMSLRMEWRAVSSGARLVARPARGLADSRGPCGLSTPPEGCQWGGASNKKRAAPYAGRTSTEMFTLLLIHLASQTASTMRQNG